jgi:hypothetical protein
MRWAVVGNERGEWVGPGEGSQGGINGSWEW